MYAHLVGQRPELASGTWSVPGYGKGTLRELLVERGVVPAELADRYAVAGVKARPGGGRARQEAARAKEATGATAASPADAYASADGEGGGGSGPGTPGGRGGSEGGRGDGLPPSGGGGGGEPPSGGGGGKPPSSGDGGDDPPSSDGDGKPPWEPQYPGKENGEEWKQEVRKKRESELKQWAAKRGLTLERVRNSELGVETTAAATTCHRLRCGRLPGPFPSAQSPETGGESARPKRSCARLPSAEVARQIPL